MDRRKQLDAFRKKVDASFNLSEQNPINPISTGIITLDMQLGVGGWARGFIHHIYGPAASGKALADDEPILTPNGWVEIGKLKAGDFVIGGSGTACNVMGVYPQGVLEVYNVKFSDGTEIKASGDHIWSVKTCDDLYSGNDARNLTTEEMVNIGLKRGGRSRFSVQPVTVDFNERELPLHPYVLGVLLGDGNFTDVNVRLTNSENDVVERFCSLLDDSDLICSHGNEHRIKTRDVNREKTKVKSALIELGLDGLLSHEKFIPNEYLFSSKEQRIELLRGLIDTDGYMTSSRRPEYTTSSKRLANDVAFVIRSLGGYTSIRSKKPTYTYKGKSLVGKESYSLAVQLPYDIIPYSSKKHIEKESKCSRVLLKNIVSIESLGHESCTCIAVDDPTHVFLARNCTPTHNTALCNTTVADLMAKDKDALVCYIDVEGTIRKEWLEDFGVDTSRVEIVLAGTSEDATNALQSAVRQGIFDLVILDSIGAMPRSVEVDGKDGRGGDANNLIMGGSAAAITRMVKVVTTELNRKRAEQQEDTDTIVPAVLLINQVRMDFSGYGDPMSFGGGKALEHAMVTNVRVTARKSKDDILMGTIKEGVQAKVGNLVQAVIQKNKLAPAPRTATWYFTYVNCPEHKFGIDLSRALVDIAMEEGYLVGAGAWFTLFDKETGEQLCKVQGKSNVAKFIDENEEIREKLINSALKRENTENIDD